MKEELGSPRTTGIQGQGGGDVAHTWAYSTGQAKTPAPARPWAGARALADGPDRNSLAFARRPDGLLAGLSRVSASGIGAPT